MPIEPVTHVVEEDKVIMSLSLVFASRIRSTPMATSCVTFVVAPATCKLLCPARPQLVNELSMAIFKAYQLAVDNGSADSYDEFMRRVAFYEVSPDFR